MMIMMTIFWTSWMVSACHIIWATVLGGEVELVVVLVAVVVAVIHFADGTDVVMVAVVVVVE